MALKAAAAVWTQGMKMLPRDNCWFDKIVDDLVEESIRVVGAEGRGGGVIDEA